MTNELPFRSQAVSLLKFAKATFLAKQKYADIEKIQSRLETCSGCEFWVEKKKRKSVLEGFLKVILMPRGEEVVKLNYTAEAIRKMRVGEDTGEPETAYGCAKCSCVMQLKFIYEEAKCVDLENPKW